LIQQWCAVGNVSHGQLGDTMDQYHVKDGSNNSKSGWWAFWRENRSAKTKELHQVCPTPPPPGSSLQGLTNSGWDMNWISFPPLLLRFLEPDPLLLVNEPGREGNVTNPKFHSLNKAIVQLVSSCLTGDTYIHIYQPHLHEIDRGPSPCLLLTSRSHQSRFSRDCYQSRWLYYAIWWRWRTEGGEFFSVNVAALQRFLFLWDWRFDSSRSLMT